MYQLIKLEINNLVQNRNNMNESLKHSVNEMVLMKIHCNNMEMKTSMIVFLSHRVI